MRTYTIFYDGKIATTPVYNILREEDGRVTYAVKELPIAAALHWLFQNADDDDLYREIRGLAYGGEQRLGAMRRRSAARDPEWGNDNTPQYLPPLTGAELDAMRAEVKALTGIEIPSGADGEPVPALITEPSDGEGA